MKNFLRARWENLVMANYEIDPQILLPFLPHGTKPDMWSGKCYVSLVGFLFVKTKVFGIPVPGMGTFEEVNLRFYVTREENGIVKRGVVFINETVPYKAVAWLANKLYKEHYTCIPTRRHWNSTDVKKIEYYWKPGKEWNHLKVIASLEAIKMTEGSKEEFILEHYYGYTRISDTATDEYEVAHPRWEVHPVSSYDIICDFEKMYGKDFAFLGEREPASVFLATGSEISVKWKRSRLTH